MNNFNLEKFKNAILFFAESTDNLGITKLNKLLYYSDFKHYSLYGRSITGDDYVRMKRGPVPSTCYSTFNANFKDEEDDCLKDVIDVKKKILNSLFSGDKILQKKIIPKKDINFSVFSESELEIMADVAKEWKKSTATEISEKSHEEDPWKNTAEHKMIDYKFSLDGNKEEISKEYADFREKEEETLQKILSR